MRGNRHSTSPVRKGGQLYQLQLGFTSFSHPNELTQRKSVPVEVWSIRGPPTKSKQKRRGEKGDEEKKNNQIINDNDEDEDDQHSDDEPILNC